MKTLDYIEKASEKEIREALKVFITDYAGKGVISNFRKAAGIPTHGYGEYKKKFATPNKVDVLEGNMISFKIFDQMIEDKRFMAAVDDILLSANRLYLRKRPITIDLIIMYLSDNTRKDLCGSQPPDKRTKQLIGCLLRISRYRNFSNTRASEGGTVCVNEWTPTKMTREWEVKDRIEYAHFMIGQLKNKDRGASKHPSKPVKPESIIDSII